MNNDSTTSESNGGWVISLAFWLTLLFAAGLYGLVALSPKLLAFLELRRTHHNIQVRLVSLEDEVQDLQTIVDSLEHDPDFVRKLAQVEFGTAKSEEERIAVDEPLQLDMQAERSAAPRPAITEPWYESFVRPFAINRDLRSATLLAAVILLLLAFVGWHPTRPAVELEPSR